MTTTSTIKINFRGGIISPGELHDVLVATVRSGIHYVRFGLRQQLLIDVPVENVQSLTEQLSLMPLLYELDKDEYPNITSSYAAEEVFIHNTWLSEGVYKDIFDGIRFSPRLKINVSDTNQSFTPMLTGNINWVASSSAPHFWHLFVRFPKTNIIYEWSQMVYTNDVANMSAEIEKIIFEHRSLFYDNPSASGNALFEKIMIDRFITRPAGKPAVLPSFNLPYYEGLNRYNNKYWLGIYRRDELFPASFLIDICRLALVTKIGQLCSTPWKSVIVKGIEEKDKLEWNHLLEKHSINMRHAANELNFQVEDNCRPALQLKNYLVRKLNENDTRTFGVCIGIKTKRKSEVFSNILVRRKPLISFFGIGMFYLYDILCARNFNPNERTGFAYSRNNPKFLLGEQLRRSVISYYRYRSEKNIPDEKMKPEVIAAKTHDRLQKRYVFQCSHCLTVSAGAGKPMDSLPGEYACSVCDAPAADMRRVEAASLGLQPV